jgi:hypothetical protein
VVGDEAGEDARGDADAVDDDDEIEGCRVGHAEFVAGEGCNLGLLLALGRRVKKWEDEGSYGRELRRGGCGEKTG